MRSGRLGLRSAWFRWGKRWFSCLATFAFARFLLLSSQLMARLRRRRIGSGRRFRRTNVCHDEMLSMIQGAQFANTRSGVGNMK